MGVKLDGTNGYSDNDGTSPGPLVGQSAAKAWSNLNGTGTIAERDSFNISGYVDNGTGDYDFTISSDMSDANFGAVSVAGNGVTNFARNAAISALAAGSVNINICVTTSGAAGDVTHALLTIHGDLA